MNPETTKRLVGSAQRMHRQKGVDAPPAHQQRTKLFPSVSHIGLVIENALDAPELRNTTAVLITSPGSIPSADAITDQSTTCEASPSPRQFSCAAAATVDPGGGTGPREGVAVGIVGA